MMVLHVVERVAAEVRWHEELLTRMPKIAADFRAGVGGVTPQAQAEQPHPRFRKDSRDQPAGQAGPGPSRE